MSYIEKYEFYNGLALGTLAGLIAGAVLSQVTDKEIELPECRDHAGENEPLNIQPLNEDQVTQALGRTGVCKVGEETFTITLPEPSES